MNEYLDPKVIIMVVVALVMLVVGVYAFFSLWTDLEEIPEFEASGQECQAVINPAIQQTVTIPEGVTITRVYETLITGVTQNIDAANYTYAGTTVTINVTG